MDQSGLRHCVTASQSQAGLAFKRFLDIALVLDADVDVVTDNDGDIDKLKKKYADYDNVGKIGIWYDEDVSHATDGLHVFEA